MTPEEIIALPLIERLARTMWNTSWLPATTQVLDRPDLCCIVSRLNPQQNMVVRFRCPPEQTAALMAEVSTLYADAPCTFPFYPHAHGEEVKTALVRHGFYEGNRHDAQILRVEDYQAPPTEGITVRAVKTLEDIEQVYAVRAQAFGTAPTYGDAELRTYLKGCTGPNTVVRQFLAIDDATGTPIAQAGLSLRAAVRLGFFFAGATLVDHRCRGAYSALVAARVAYAKRIGFDAVGVFAREATSSPIVTRQGFQKCGTMTYWERDVPARN